MTDLDLVTMKPGIDEINLNGSIDVHFQSIDGQVNGICLTDGISKYFIRTDYESIKILQPAEQAEPAKIEACLANPADSLTT